MTRAQQLARLLAALCAAVVVLVAFAAAASAREHPPLEVADGRPASGTYPAIVGVQGAHGPAAPETCRTGPGCDVIPLTIISTGAVPAGADALLSVTVRWDATEGNVLNAALFTEDDGPSPDAGRNEVPGLVKWTTGGADGSLVLRAANPPPGSYRLTVASTTGVNRGFDIGADLAVHRAGEASAPTSPAGVADREPADTAATTAVQGADQPRVAAALASADAGAEGGHPHVRTPDARFDGVVGVSTARLKPSHPVRDALPWALVALGLLGAVSAKTWLTAGRQPMRLSFRDLRLFWKLMAPFVIVIVIVGVIGTFLSARYLAGRAESELSRRLLQSNTSAAGYLRDQEFALLDASRYSANVQGLPEALSGAQGPETEQALASVAAVYGQLDVIAAVTPGGRSLSSLTRSGGAVAAHAGESWADAPPVRDAIAGVIDRAGDKHAGFIQLQDGTMMLIVAAPVRTDRVVGAVVVGRRTQPIVAEAAERSDASVTVYSGSLDRVATSDGLSPERLTSEPTIGEARRERHEVGGREVGRLLTPLELRDRRVGSLMVSVPVGSAFEAVRDTSIRLGLLVAAGLAAIVAIGGLLSRNILRTVQALLATNRALGRGELGARAPVHGNDELGELAVGFNQMAEQLEASYQQLERRVSERTEELQHLYQSREEFFASVSHELRTPLFAILANSELLTDPDLAPDDHDEQVEMVETIHTSARQLVASVNDLLDLAKAEAAAVSLELSDLDPAAVLDEVLASLVALGRREDVEVVLERPRRLTPVKADRDRLVQILLNLGSNAVKYTPPGGRVSIAARNDAGGLEVVVKDTGLGIPPDVGEKVFEPYYVVERNGRRTQPSTGLGLAITRRLVLAHGGTIGFTSTPGAGTTFTLRIPFVPGSDQAATD